MARSIWSGAISFGLISIPVKLFTAVRPQGRVVQPARRPQHGPDPLREGVRATTGEVVPAEHIVKGVEISKGRYVIVDPDELAPFVPLATKTIDVEEFVDPAEIDPVLFDTHLLRRPRPRNAEAVRAAGHGRWSSTGKVGDRPVRDARPPVRRPRVRADDGRLVMSTLVYADEVVPVADVEELAGLDDGRRVRP